MSGKSIMNKFVIRNIVRMMVNCSYFCVFYLMILSALDTAGVGANKLPEEDISMVTEVNKLEDGSSPGPNENKSGGAFSSDVGFVHAFIASFSVIIVSELGDKTFFIAAIMAMRHPRLTVFSGAIAALALMTVLSAVFGMAATIIPRVYTYYISTALFALFGLKMLKDGYYMSATEAAEELEEVQSDLRKREDELMRSLNGSRRETVELVPLNENTSSKGMSSPDRNGGSTLNGSIHSLVSNNHDLPQPPHLTTIRMSASASQLQTSNHHLASHHLSDSSNGINRNKLASSKSLAVTIGEQNEQRQRARSGLLANGTAAAGAIANGTVAGLTDENDNTTPGSTGSHSHSKRLEKETSAAHIQDTETGVIRKNKQRSALNLLMRIFMQAFTMTFLAEWGDRSQLTTIILSARENVYGVITGGVIGHAICTGLAVIGGRMIAQKISVRTVTLIGGVVFLLFAVSALFFSPEEDPVDVSP
ncbi:transmembrane protein 165 [Toxorhynchites rutilus septentrionalis]|uniref:transmembrane protein 165 n=1 Tax=Toxorhynchites rutilus septentrionalis TaxID=329112 RepID=UPI002479FAB6|nr:transmembrane protein 165 [Toxorhynchites rutilus septentrionalis]